MTEKHASLSSKERVALCLRVSSEDVVPVELDGELAGICPVEFKVQPRQLKVLTQM